MKNKKFQIIIETAEKTIFSATSKTKDINEWLEIYGTDKNVKAIKIYCLSDDKLSYVLTTDYNKRRIGF